jgi:hypothetical protein
MAGLSLGVPRSVWWLAIALGCIFAVVGSTTHVDAGWFASGDAQLRMDLRLLNDAEVIRLPVNQWPLPRTSLTYALGEAKEQLAVNAAVAGALHRVRARVSEPTKIGVLSEASARGGSAGLWRDFETQAREDGELGAGIGWNGDRFSGTLAVTAVANDVDRDDIRPDGSHATVHVGNWLLSAHLLDRWWGPAHQGSAGPSSLVGLNGSDPGA